MTIAQIREHWLAGGSVASPSEQSPDNPAVVYVADFISDMGKGETIVCVMKEHDDGRSPDWRPLVLWWQIPRDKVADWVNGSPKGNYFDVWAARGTLRLERPVESPDPQIAQFYVYRRDTGEYVAYSDVFAGREHVGFADGKHVCFIEPDAFEALQPFRERARVMLSPAQRFGGQGLNQKADTRHQPDRAENKND